MTQISAWCFFTFLLLTSSVNTKKRRFPSFITKCHQSDPEVKYCYELAAEATINHFKSGIPEFGLPVMDPLILPRLNLESAANFQADLHNVEVYNLSELKILYFKVNLDANSFTMELLFPRIRIKSQYAIKGKVLFLELDGNGPADGNFTNTEIHAKMTATRYKNHDKEYLNFTTLQLKENFDKVVLKFDGLFPGNPELTTATNQIINENVKDFIRELEPVLRQAITETVLGLIKPKFSTFSVNELFPK